MSVTKALNSKSNIKQFSNADYPINPRQPVIAKYGPVDSTASQTVINLPFQVDTVNAQDSFFLAVDGKILSIGAANDYTMTAIDALGFSSQVTLTSSLAAGLNIQAWKLGLKKESEFAQDQRFTNVYESLDKGFQGFVDTSALLTPTTTPGTPSPGTFYSSIIGRASLPDYTQDLKPRMGVERIMVNYLQTMHNEFGPNGEAVASCANSIYDNGQIRFVGSNWGWGPNYGYTSTANDYVEVTFYGTGLNLLTQYDTGTRDNRAALDGGSYGGSSIIPSTNSAVLNAKGYTQNVIVPVYSGLSAGIHTVQIKLNTAGVGLTVYGFEILNEHSTIKVNPGNSYVQGKKLSLSSQSVTNYNDVVTGTKGGRVLVYQKSDGTIAKAWQATDPTQNTLTATDHSQEEVARNYYWREFGIGKWNATYANQDDFGMLQGTARSAAFALDDNSTNLVGATVDNANIEAMGTSSVGGYIQFTFVGTGLDMLLYTPAAGLLASQTISVDGTNILTSTQINAPSIGYLRYKIASGLPYGSHTVRITKTVANGVWDFRIAKIIAYQPKKPTLPSGSSVLADYNVMGAVTATASAAITQMCGGSIFKTCNREFAYTGTWAVTTLDTTNFDSAYPVSTSTSGAAWEYTFHGTGFEITQWIGAGSQNLSLLITNLATNTTVNAASYTNSFSNAGSGLTWTPGNPSTLTGTQVAGRTRIRVSGMPQSTYRIKFTFTSTAGTSYVDNIMINVPTHTHKFNDIGDFQNTIIVGSNNLGDSRNLTPVKDVLPVKKAWAQAIGTQSNPTYTGSTAAVPVPDLTTSIVTNGGALEISFTATVLNNTLGSYISSFIFLDGVQQAPHKSVQQYVANHHVTISDSIVVPVAPGAHTVTIFISMNGAGQTITYTGTQRNLTLKEL